MSAESTNAEIARIATEADRNGLSDEDVLDRIKRLAAPTESRGRALGLGGRRAESKAKGPRLRDDPRYLAGVRALARRTQSNARIVGGDEVTGHEFDDCVAVGSDSTWGCTGTLVAPDVVLTAGHCQELHTRVFVGNDVSGGGRIVRIRDHVRHQRFGNGLRNDLMLLFLEEQVIGVPPRAIAGAALVDTVNDARIVGFGTTDFGGTRGYGRKRKADVPIVSQACRGRVGRQSDAAVYGCHVGLELVAGKPLLLVDTCRGDSGGPLYVQDSKGNWLLAGVTSRGTSVGPLPSERLCGDGGMYVRADEYRTWIADEIRQHGATVTKPTTSKKTTTRKRKNPSAGTVAKKGTAAKTSKKTRTAKKAKHSKKPETRARR